MPADPFADIFPGILPATSPAASDADPFAGLLSPQTVASQADIPPEEIARVRKVGDFLTRPVKDLIDDPTFDPVSAWRDTDFSADEEAQRKVLEVFKARESESHPLASAGNFFLGLGKGAVNFLPSIGTAAGNIAGQLTNAVEGVVHNNPDRAMGAVGELLAAGDANAEGLAGLFEHAKIKLLDGKPKNDRQWEILLSDLGNIRDRQEKAERGEGRILKGATALGGPGVSPAEFAASNGGTIDPENVRAAEPLLDPSLLVGLGAGAKVAQAAERGLIERGVEAGLKGAAKGTKAVVAPALSVAGKVATKVGDAASHLGGLPTVAAGLELASGVTGAPVVGTYLAGKFGPKAIQKVGRGLTDAAASVAGSAPPGPIMRAAGAALDSDLLKTITVGAAHGVAGDPLAAAFTTLNLLGSENAEQAGQMIGMQGAAGAGGATLSRASSELGKYFDIKEQGFGSRQASGEATKPVVSPDYGLSPNLDAANREALAALPQWAQNRINAIREAIRPLGKYAWVLPSGDFGRQIADIFEQQALADGKVLPPERLASIAEDANNSNGVFAEKLKIGDKTIDAIFMREDDTSLAHEGIHLWEKLLPPDKLRSIHDSIQKNFSPEELQTFSDQYTALLKQTDPGFVMTPERLASEITAEIGSVALNGVPLDTLNLPQPVQRAVYQGLLKVFSKLGYDTGKTELGLRRDPFVAALAENVIRSEAAARNPAAPVASKTNPANVKIAQARPAAVPVRNIRATVEDQSRFKLENEENYTRVAAAVDANKNLTPEQKNAFVNVSANLTQGGSNPHPIEIEYNSVKAGEYQAARTARRAEQEKAYGAEVPSAVRALVQKILVPTRFLLTKDGGVQLLGMSLDKVTANAHIIAKDAASRKASDLIPYQTQGGNLTEAGWKDLVKDIQTYTANQANGYAGNGKPVVVPADYKGDVPAQNGAYTPVALADDKANFVNVLMALPPPRTTDLKAKTASGVPANISARKLAEANAKPALTSVTSNPKRNFFDDYGVEIAEFNPLRDALAKKGVKVRDLIEVTERVNLDEVKDIKIRPDLELSRPVTDLIRAGFMPDPKKASRSGNQEVRDVADEYTKKAGIEYRPFDAYVKPPEDLLKSIADWYDKSESSPQDPAVQAAYKSLSDQTLSQYQAMIDAGYTIEPWTDTKGEPYKSSADMVRDVKENKHLWYFPTKNGFGSREFDVSTNPLLAAVPGTDMVVNDVFRAVHDFYGHAKEGYEFGPRGEFNAFLAHSSMFTPEAIPALASETLAQNAWVNAGPHLRREDGSLPTKGDKDFKPLTERPFADQKVLAVPQELLDKALALKQTTVEPLGKKHLVMEGVGDPVEQFQVRKPGDERGVTMTREEAQKAAPDAKFQPNPEDSQLEGFHGSIRERMQKAMDSVERTEYEPGDVLYTARGTKVEFISDLLGKKGGANDGEQRVYVRFPDGAESSVLLSKLSPVPGGEGASFMPKVQHTADAPLPDSVGDQTFKATHYTGQTDLKTVDPKFMKPKAGTFQKMYRGENKAFFFADDSKPLEGENVSAKGKPVKYEATISGDRLYDMDSDPKDLWFAKNPAKADQQLKDEGYAGYIVTTGDGRRFIAMYEPTKVSKVAAPKETASPKVDDFNIGSVEVSVRDDYLAAREDGGTLSPTLKKSLIQKAKELGKSEVTFDDGNDTQTIWEASPSMAFAPKTGKEAKAYRDISPYLTEAERAEMRNDVATDVVKIFKELPADEEFQAAVQLGSAKMGWYNRAAVALKQLFGADTEKFVTLLAATSPRQTVQENLLMSLKIWNDWTKAGRPTDVATTREIVERYAEMDNRVKNSVTSLLGSGDLRQPLDKDATISGFKVESFKRNLLGDSNAVTNDTWMALFSGVDQALFGTKAGYLATAAKARRVAESMEISPAEVQETVWSFYKTLIEKTTLDRPAKETLNAITQKDIAETPEFYELLHSHPEIQSALLNAGVVQLGEDGKPHLSHLVDPEYAGQRAGAGDEPVIRAYASAGEDRGRILDRVAIRAQKVKDSMLEKRAESRKANEAAY